MPRCLRFLLLPRLALATATATAEVDRRTANDGNVLLEGVPEIPGRIVERLGRYLENAQRLVSRLGKRR